MNTLMVAVVASALCVQASVASAAPASQDLFFSACLEGEARLSKGDVTEVGFAGLPESVRQKYRVPQTARVWRIASEDTFLYLFDMSDGHGNTNKICGVASKEMERNALTLAIDVRLAGSTEQTPRRSTQWLRPTDGFVVTVTTAKRYTVAQVDWLSERDRQRIQKEVDLFAQ